METGKVEYSPDYKSRQPRVKISSTGARSIEPFDIVRSEAGRAEIEAQQSRSWKADHQRLQSAIVEKARIMLEINEAVGHVCLDVEDTLEATRHLVQFESEHGIGEK